MALSCNDEAYVYAQEQSRSWLQSAWTLQIRANYPRRMTFDNYRCHNELRFGTKLEELNMFRHLIPGGLTALTPM